MHVSQALEELGLDNTATKADVKQAYKDLARIWHPDRFQHDERLGTRTEAKIKLINEARTVAVAYIDKYGHFQHVGGDKFQDAYQRAKSKTQAQQEQPPPRQKQASPRPKKEAPPRERSAPKREAPRPKPETSPPPETDNKSSFQMDQSGLVILFIMLVLVSFLFMLGTSLLNPSEDKIKALTKKISQADGKSDLRKKWDARREEEAALAVSKNIPEPVKIDTFFTLGSDKIWVSEVQGPPDQIMGLEWRYGKSSVLFADDQVVGWNSSEFYPLKISMLLDSIWVIPDNYFGIGSFVQEVIALQGTPDAINEDRWSYGDAVVTFDADTVVSWQNDDQEILQLH